VNWCISPLVGQARSVSIARAQQNRRGGAPQDRFDQEKSAVILIQLDREVASIGDNFNKILKLRERSYSRRSIEL
jgi:hypothetical protein